MLKSPQGFHPTNSQERTGAIGQGSRFGKRRLSGLICIAAGLLWLSNPPHSRAAETAAPADFNRVHEIFTKHCLDCHASVEPEGKLVLETFETLLKGGENGAAIVPHKSQESLLVKMIEGSISKDGKPRIMPPGKRTKLTSEEIAAVKGWIDAGAPGPVGGAMATANLKIPKIVPKGAPRRQIFSVAQSSSTKLIAVGRYGEVELFSAGSRGLVRTLKDFRGSINALVFSSDGKTLFAAGGEAGISGEVRQWNTIDGSLIRAFTAHQDAIYSAALSPDDQVLATGSYDQKVKLWNAETGSELKTLTGHNGAVFDLSFRPDGKILASASADRTVKLWDVASGERRDTLAQSTKEVNAVVFSSDGKYLYGGGADNRIRMWQISDSADETTNPLLEARFAHEGAILKMVLSQDGKSLASAASDQRVKLWNVPELKERLLLEPQPDWVAGLALFGEGKSVSVGRLDGSLAFYDANSGAVLPPPKPELARSEPRGFQRGTETKIKLIGSNLAGLKDVKAADARLKIELLKTNDAGPNEVWVNLETPSDLPRGAYELWVSNENGASGRIKLHADTLPQISVQHSSDRTVVQEVSTLPINVWSTHTTPGEAEELTLRAEEGQSLVFEVAAKKLGSRSDIVLTLSDPEGKVLASSTGFGPNDPHLFFTFKEGGQYKIRAQELVLGASPDHYYRLSIGAFPYVTGCFPLSVPVGKESAVELIGFNLPSERRLKVNPGTAGEFPLPLDPEVYRARREFKLLASDVTESVEVEPNNKLDQATALSLPGSVGGRIHGSAEASDADYYNFTAKAGERWVLETTAAQRGSPVDTKLEILDDQGNPVERLLLQGVRDSSVTFRGIDSDTIDCRLVNWEEMELNQYLYMQGEVLKLFRAPQGPDSGFLFYFSNGKRRCYFDTSPSAHAVDEPCYIVEAHPPGTKLVSNGLPAFPIYFTNDDDGERKLGADSKVLFTVPADGKYFARITDTRGLGGEGFVYRLLARPVAPDFAVRLKGTPITLNRGSGKSFAIEADRADGFEGAIEVSIHHLPKGFAASTPLLIEAGHREAKGTIHAAADAPAPLAEDWAKVQVVASAMVEGQHSLKAVNNFGVVQLAEKPKLFVFLEPDSEAALAGGGASTNLIPVSASANAPASNAPLELTIAPGESIPALLRVQRNGHDDLITFNVENLPHGVIVDNIGLNGVLIPKGQSERRIYITAARWVQETDRLCYAVESQAGQQTSLPVLLHVRKSREMQAAR